MSIGDNPYLIRAMALAKEATSSIPVLFNFGAPTLFSLAGETV
jgi:hypothetical protein